MVLGKHAKIKLENNMGIPSIDTRSPLPNWHDTHRSNDEPSKLDLSQAVYGVRSQIRKANDIYNALRHITPYRGGSFHLFEFNRRPLNIDPKLLPSPEQKCRLEAILKHISKEGDGLSKEQFNEVIKGCTEKPVSQNSHIPALWRFS